MEYLYDDFDVVRAKSDLNICITNINCETEENLKTNILNNEVWCCDSRDKLNGALEILIDTRYVQLKNKLKEAMMVLNHIETYKNYVSAIRSKQQRISALNPGAIENESYTSSDGSHHTRSVYHENDQKQIDDLRRQIEEDKRQLEHYSLLINNALSSF